MSKQISPNELAEIITGLLVKPNILGEEMTSQQHKKFMLEIGEVVADNFGGIINSINDNWTGTNEGYGEITRHSSTLMSVSPDERIPSLNVNVWACHDATGWEEEVLDYDVGIELTSEERAVKRGELQWLLVEPDEKGFDLTQSNFFKSKRLELISAVEEAADKAKVSPKNFTIDESLCDCGEIETSEVVGVLSEAAGMIGDYGTKAYKSALNDFCDSINTHFGAHN